MTSTPSAPASKSSRFWTLDAARGLAALAIVGYHVLIAVDADANLSESSKFWGWLRYSGPIGVSTFFVLSGFSVHLSQARKLVAKENYRVAWVKFFRRRFWRIYPAYLGAIIFCIMLNFTWALIRRRDLFANLPTTWNLLSHLLMLHTLQAETFFGIIPALWFIGVQAHLYLLYPCFYWLVKRWNIHYALLIVLISTLGFRLISQSIVIPPNAHPQTQEVLWMNAPQLWFDWCFGAWVAQQVAKEIRFPVKYGWLLFILTLVGIGASNIHYVRVLGEPILATLIGLFIWYVVTREKGQEPHPSWKTILYVGQLSYSVYLLHQIFLPYINSVFDTKTFNGVGLFAVVLGGVLGITLPVADLFNRYIELPFSKVGERQSHEMKN